MPSKQKSKPHPARELFPVVTDKEWAIALRRARREINEIHEQIKGHMSARRLAKARQDGL